MVSVWWLPAIVLIMSFVDGFINGWKRRVMIDKLEAAHTQELLKLKQEFAQERIQMLLKFDSDVKLNRLAAYNKGALDTMEKYGLGPKKETV